MKRTSTTMAIYLLFALVIILPCQILSAQITPVLTDYSRPLPPVFFGYNGNNVCNKNNEENVFTWETPALRKAVPQLNSTYFRFPPGGKAKSWDWNAGWYYDPIYQVEDNAPN